MTTRFTEVTVTVPSPVTAEDLTTAATMAARHFPEGKGYLRALESRPGRDGTPELTDMVFTSEPRQATTGQESTR